MKAELTFSGSGTYNADSILKGWTLDELRELLNGDPEALEVLTSDLMHELGTDALEADISLSRVALEEYIAGRTVTTAASAEEHA
jgi:hypothetical protein